MSASIVQAEPTGRMNLNPKFAGRRAHTLQRSDSGVDDPVNDTGLGPGHGDLQMPDEFAGLLSMICVRNGESQ